MNLPQFSKPTTMKSKKTKIKYFMENWELLVMALPAMIIVFVFSYIPMFGIIIAFKNFKFDKGLWDSPWVGFKNFEFFFNTEDAWRITRNTIGLNLLFILVGTICSIGLALVLYEVTKKRLVKLFQTTMIFPHFLSWVVVGYMFYAIFNVQHGILNSVIQFFGGDAIDWYMLPNKWPGIFVGVIIWKGVGWGSIIYYASLMGIDNQFFEAAKIDGANKMQQIRYISIPFLSSIVLILTILGIGGIMRSDFGMFFYLTRDMGTLYSTTDVIDTYVYRSLKTIGDVGMSSAAGLYQSVVGFILILTTNYIVNKINPENSLF
jgi:putative aldouronate transport system permease protein